MVSFKSLPKKFKKMGIKIRKKGYISAGIPRSRYLVSHEVCFAKKYQNSKVRVRVRVSVRVRVRMGRG
jgi:hypothetical protein